MAEVLDRGIVCEGYTNHAGSTRDGQNNIFAAFTCTPEHGYPTLIIKRRQHGTGAWSVVHTFDPGPGGSKKFGYCTLEAVGLHLVVLASQRDDATGAVVDREYIILNVCEL